MVTRPNSPASKGREELVKQVSMLPAFLLKNLQQGKTWDELGDIARGIEGEGGSNLDVLRETEKFTDPATSTGVYREPGGSLVFNVPDEGMKLTPQAERMLSQRMVGAPHSQTPVTELDKLMQHDLLYGFVPELRQQPTQLGKLSNKNYDDPPYGTYMAPGVSYPDGFIEAMGRGWLDPQSSEHMSTRNILAHEVNHALQNRFKLPGGANPDHPDMLDFFSKDMQPHAGDVAQQYSREFEDWFATQGQGMNIRDAEALWERLYPEKMRLAQDARIMNGYDIRSGADRQAMYEGGVAGEVAANRASRDLGKGIEQLRAEVPFAADPDQMSAPMQMLRYGNTVTDWEKSPLGLGGVAFRGRP